MHKLERFILKPKMGQVKKQLSIRVLSKLFYNDENLTGLFFDSLTSRRYGAMAFFTILFFYKFYNFPSFSLGVGAGAPDIIFLIFFLKIAP